MPSCRSLSVVLFMLEMQAYSFIYVAITVALCTTSSLASDGVVEATRCFLFSVLFV